MSNEEKSKLLIDGDSLNVFTPGYLPDYQVGCSERNKTCNLRYMSGFDEATTQKIGAIRDILSEADARIRNILRPSREASLFYTKLEEACMWAIKSLCLDATFEEGK